MDNVVLIGWGAYLMSFKKNNAKLSGILCGVSGEYFVAAELSRRGYIASLTLRNTRGVDILASNADATKSVGIQVKTAQGGKNWMLTAKAEKEAATNLVYVFVRLNGLAEPQYFVVPRKTVTKFIAKRHRDWLTTPGRNGQPHKDTSIRHFRDDANEYLDRWDLLGLD
jgi:hypothetical protein